ncbi:HNH endonuclease signature motif containing protein [Chitinophaga sp.]|uniref:HNH endonuclease n=1 Tax=Chitinophaga sp. TaxID=1869181 RepID=UPI0031E157EB
MLIPKKRYYKEDIYRELSVPVERQKGSWNTGYVKYEGCYYIFANIGVAGRTGHDYDNHWEGDDLLVWHGKNESHVGQNSIQEMLSRKVPVHIFTRDQDRSPFLYEGLGIAINHEETTPVKIEWDIIQPSGEKDIDEVIEAIVTHAEAPNDVIKKMVAALKRLRTGQRALKEGLMKLYEGRCCISGSSIEQLLIACHIEPHKEKGNNHSTNGLLMRVDLHILFDANLIGIEPDTLKVRIGRKLKGSEYEYLDGMVLRQRKDGMRPDRAALAQRWKKFVSVSV